VSVFHLALQPNPKIADPSGRGPFDKKRKDLNNGN
jgi:hypothetical protein